MSIPRVKVLLLLHKYAKQAFSPASTTVSPREHLIGLEMRKMSLKYTYVWLPALSFNTGSFFFFQIYLTTFSNLFINF